MRRQLPRLHDWIAEQCVVLGGRTWRLQALGAPPLVVVSTPELFEDVTRAQLAVFDKGERMAAIFQDAMGGGIFAVDGDAWLRQRKLLSRIFTMRAFKDTIARCFRDNTRVLGSVLDRAVDGEPLDLGDALHRFTFDLFTDVAFGLQEKTLERGDRCEFIDATSTLALGIETRFHQPDWPWQLKRALGVGVERQIAQSIAAINKIVYKVIAESLAKKREVDDAESKRPTKDIISLFTEHSKLQQEASGAGEQAEVDPKMLHDVCTSILLASKDTTALTMSWLVVMLNREPEVASKIREELRRVLPRLFSDPAFVPTMDDVDQLMCTWRRRCARASG